MKDYHLYKMRKTTIATVLLSLLFVVMVVIIVVPNGIAPNIIGTNHKNVTVWTYVNITNSKTEVMNVTIYAENNFTMRNITVIAGATRMIYCNATIRDWDGFNNVVYVNGTLWHVPTSNYTLDDDNNSHYTNTSCTLNGTTASPYIGWYVCAFEVWYYANNGTWNCNVTAMDTENKSGWKHNSTLFYPVYALNVTDGIDYGNVAVEDYSDNRTANVTNLGNMGINISVEGYGVTRGDGLAMRCTLAGNITVANERYSTDDVDYASKISLTSAAGGAVIPNLTMPKQTVHNSYVVNTTHWQLYIPPNPAGNCTGYVIFTALAP